MTVTAQNNDTQSQWISDFCTPDMLPSQTSQSHMFDRTTFEIILTHSSPHELLPQSHSCLEGEIPCSVIFPSKLLTKQSPPTEAETKEESGDSQKMKASKKRLRMWKESIKRRCKKARAKKEWRDSGRARAGGSKRSPERKKKKGSWIYNYNEEEWDAFWRFCVGLSTV